MPWLVVLGAASWVTGRNRFEAGVHEVDEEIAEKARNAGVRSLVVCETEPELAPDRKPGPLKPEDLQRSYSEHGVRLHVVPPLEAEPPAEDAYVIPLDYPCPQCPSKFPSQGARKRHVEFNH